MTIHDEELELLVENQAEAFSENAPEKVKVNILKAIQKRQKKLRKKRGEDDDNEK